jgi:hypothetical protein
VLHPGCPTQWVQFRDSLLWEISRVSQTLISDGVPSRRFTLGALFAVPKRGYPPGSYHQGFIPFVPLQWVTQWSHIQGVPNKSPSGGPSSGSHSCGPLHGFTSSESKSGGPLQGITFTGSHTKVPTRESGPGYLLERIGPRGFYLGGPFQWFPFMGTLPEVPFQSMTYRGPL